MKVFIGLMGLMGLMLGGCTVVSCDRVFPKLSWYWSAEAKRQRQSDADERAFHEASKTNQALPH